MSDVAQRLAQIIGLDTKNVLAFNIRARPTGVTVTVQKFQSSLEIATDRFYLSLLPIVTEAPKPEAQAKPGNSPKVAKPTKRRLG